LTWFQIPDRRNDVPVITVTPSNWMRAKLEAALRGRLALLPLKAAAIPLIEEYAEDTCEEALRKLSVPLRARLVQRTLSNDDQRDIKDALTIIASRVGWVDVRYLDAFNVYYESWKADYLPELGDHFLALYRAVLLRVVPGA
jgi:hypothetical protein